MNLREVIKRYLPSYRTEKRMNEKMEQLAKDLREQDKKSEYLYWLSQMQPGETMQETKERLFMKMPKATGRLRNIQLAENYILQRVKDICDENGLQFSLLGGTLLGAIRHKGFIPWDNDIDIGMLESDYLKLREILNHDAVLRTDYYYKYDSGMKIPKVKFRCNDVFWIDIFLFDYIDANSENVDEVWEKTRKINSNYKEIVCEKSAPFINEYNGVPIANFEMDSILSEFEDRQKKEFGLFGKGSYICETLDSPYWSRDPRGISLASDRLPYKKNAVEFEGRLYDAWSNYEQALTHFYGNYWSLPFSISEPHTNELDGWKEAMAELKNNGIIIGE